MTFLLAALFLGQAPAQGQTPPPFAPRTQAPAPQVPAVSLDPPKLPAPDAIVLTVNGHAFTAKELEPYLWDRFAAKVGDEFVNYELVKEEAARQNVVATDAEVSKKLHDGLQMFVAQPQNAKDPIDQLRERDFPPSRLVMATRTQILLEKLTEKSFKPDDYVKVSWILIRPKSGSADDLQKALTSAKAAYTELKRGTAWDAVVAKYSDPQAQQKNGEIGWIALTGLPKDVQAPVGALQNNGVTEPLTTPQFGIQLFRLEARGKDASAADLASLKQKSGSEMAQTLMKRLRAEAKITPTY